MVLEFKMADGGTALATICTEMACTEMVFTEMEFWETISTVSVLDEESGVADSTDLAMDLLVVDVTVIST